MAKLANLNQPTEHQIQKAAFEIIRLRENADWRYRLIYAIPNGGLRHIGVAKKMKDEGQRSGVWDIAVDVPCNNFAGLKIEVKKPGGRLTKDQISFGRLCQRAGYAVAVCFSTTEILTAIEHYLGPNPDCTSRSDSQPEQSKQVIDQVTEPRSPE